MIAASIYLTLPLTYGNVTRIRCSLITSRVLRRGGHLRLVVMAYKNMESNDLRKLLFNWVWASHAQPVGDRYAMRLPRPIIANNDLQCESVGYCRID